MNKKLGSNKNLPVKKENQILSACLYILFAILLVFLCINKISGDDDFFWHLASGRYIVENKTIPATDVFSYTTAGQRWIPFEWGWDVTTYLIFNAAGYAGIYILKSLLILGAFFLFFKILEKFKITAGLRIFFLLLLLFGVMFRFTIRPHLISYFFFALLLYIILSYKYFDRSNHKILYYIPAIFLVWANFHMGVIDGIVVYSIFAFSELLSYLFPGKLSANDSAKPDKKDLIRIFIILACSVLALLINPANVTTYAYVYSNINLESLKDINEWKSPFDSVFSSNAFVIIYKIYLGLAVFALYYSYKKKDVFIFIVSLAFALYSLKAVRFITDYIYLASVFIFTGMYYLVNNLKNNRVKNIINYHPAGKVVLMMIMIFLLINIPNDVFFNEYLGYHRIWGAGADENTLPVQMFSFAKSIKLNETGEHPFNHYSIGGLFLWNFPNSKDFIDSRYINDKVYSDYDIIDYQKPGFENKIKDYNIDYFMYYVDILLQSPQILKQIAIDYLNRNNSDWKLIYWDDKSFIYVKNTPEFQPIISKYEYKYINPYYFLYQKQIIESALANDRETVIKEVRRKKSEDPNGFIINRIIEQYKIK